MCFSFGSLGKEIVHSVCSKVVCNYSPRVVTGWIPWRSPHTARPWRSRQPCFALIERSKVAEWTFFHFKTLDTDQTDLGLRVTAHSYDANTGKSCDEIIFFPTGDRILNVNMSVPESTAFITFLSIKKQKPSVSFSRVCLSERDISPRGCKEEIKRQNNIAADLFWISSSWMEETKNKTSVPIKHIVSRVFFFPSCHSEKKMTSWKNVGKDSSGRLTERCWEGKKIKIHKTETPQV